MFKYLVTFLVLFTVIFSYGCAPVSSNTGKIDEGSEWYNKDADASELRYRDQDSHDSDIEFFSPFLGLAIFIGSGVIISILIVVLKSKGKRE